MLKEKISNQKKIQTALIGLGNIGLLYDLDKKDILTHAKSTFLNPNIQLNFAVDTKLKNRNTFIKKYKIKAYKSLKDAFDFDKIKLLIISTPTKTHLKVIKKIPEKNNLKYIILEKPGGRNYKELLEIVNFCKKNKIHLSINYFRNYLNDFKNLKNFISLRKPKKIIFWYSRGMLNNCSHLINYSLSIFGWPKTIKILDKHTKFSNETDFDFKITYKNTQIYFFCTPQKNISNNEIFFLSKNIKIYSKNDFNLVIKKKLNQNYNFKKKIIAETPKKLQSKVLEKKLFIFKNKKKDRNIKFNLMTLKLIDYIKNEKNHKL